MTQEKSEKLKPDNGEKPDNGGVVEQKSPGEGKKQKKPVKFKEENPPSFRIGRVLDHKNR